MEPRLRDWEVWTLHQALQEAEAASHVSFYLPSADDVDGIREYTDNNEGELALHLILALATPDVPDQVRERAYQVASLFADESSEADVKADVDAWLQWDPGSEVPPPYST